jgi:ABC-type uncharacterized transport system substrate-binding protein
MDAGRKYRDRQNTVVLGFRRFGVAMAVVASFHVTACTMLPAGAPDPEATQSIEPIPIPVVARLVVPPPPGPPAPTVATRPAPPPVQRPAPVILVVSSDLPAYVDVASRLEVLFGADQVKGYVLDEISDHAGLAAEINQGNPRATVAIGLDAALFAAGQLNTAPVVFCQVLNYAEHDTLKRAAAGVSALPSISQQFRYWKNVDGKLRRIGTIAGPGHEDLLAQAQLAAEEQNLDFKHRISQSDQETIYLFKRLAAQIDGFWLIPDNRILSLNAIREILSYATERRVRVVVSSPSLLKFGALMSLSLSSTLIADAVYNVVEALADDDQHAFEVFAPTRFDVEINAGVAERFGLEFD